MVVELFSPGAYEVLDNGQMGFFFFLMFFPYSRFKYLLSLMGWTSAAYIIVKGHKWTETTLDFFVGH